MTSQTHEQTGVHVFVFSDGAHLIFTNVQLIVERQMAEIWQNCAVCHTSMKFC